jgi:hypothetical protein
MKLDGLDFMVLTWLAFTLLLIVSFAYGCLGPCYYFIMHPVIHEAELSDGFTIVASL